MKIQSLAVMFIILILPISIVLATYTQNRVETLSLQTQYDSKLKGATYDALKAYQLNSFNNNTSSLANSKIRDIKASVDTFFNSLSTNFSTVGYSKETLQNYVPAVVYTMYDGYYIYAPYTNTWDEQVTGVLDDSTYHNGDSLYGLKPYVYYSCRYIKGNIDVVITYSLDNYIAIQGKIGTEVVSKYGYLMDNVAVNGENVTYKGYSIGNDILSENICIDGNVKSYKYVKENGAKHYYDESTGKTFTMLNGKASIDKDFTFPANDDYAKKYYQDSLEMKNFITSKRFKSSSSNRCSRCRGKTLFK